MVYTLRYNNCSSKTSCNYLVIFSCLFIFFSFVPPLFSAQADKDKQTKSIISAKGSGSIPLHITSDTMVIEKEASTIEFSGSVVAERDDSIINADIVKVILYSDKEKASLSEKKMNPDVKMIMAIGNVKFVSGERTAFADKAVYTSADETLVLTGDSPRVITGENFVTGNKITLFQKSGKIIIESSQKKRVEALFKSNQFKTQEN